jgi:hydrogenase maturation protein HypF
MLSTSDHIRNGNERLIERWHFDVHGVVQGVGFRPFLFGLAREHHLCGWARNTSTGVEIELEGAANELQQFEAALTTDAPPLSHILDVTIDREWPAPVPQQDFSIRPSRLAEGRTLVSPDVATCDACLEEVLNPLERRHAYPFTNCTHCGPRFTIITDLPYDREATSMQSFAMCPACGREYADPADRRFHAQPIACRDCGPQLTLVDADGAHIDVAPTGVIDHVAEMLINGEVVGIQGLGGFHVACLASNVDAVARLRTSKFRPSKPFALMMPSIKAARRICLVSQTEAKTLSSPEAPIVLLSKRRDVLPELIAPKNDCLGVMLPYTPLHHLLMQTVDAPIVMTSGNPAGQPLCIDPEEAIEKLGEFVDAFLLHDRPIVRPCDDSVVRVIGAAADAFVQPVRRSRGYVPLPVVLPKQMALTAPVLATGGDLKNVSALGAGQSVFLTQHIGDLANPQVRDLQSSSVTDTGRMFGITPEAVVCDLHPGYASSRYAEAYAAEHDLPLHRVQHHHAHIAGCLAEYGHEGPAIGLAFDGAGYGTDGRIWGGEVLTVDGAAFERTAHLEYLPLPGGDAATRWPNRVAIAYLTHLCPEVPIDRLLNGAPERERTMVEKMVQSDLQVVRTSSMGRLFDAVAAMVGLGDEVTHEGQAAIALESLATRWGGDVAPYPFVLDGGVFRLGEMLAGIVEDVLVGIPVPQIAKRFHRTIAAISVTGVEYARRTASTPLDTVALSGGCWLNQTLMAMTEPELERSGFKVRVHRNVPANDGGLAFGQTAVFAGIVS